MREEPYKNPLTFEVPMFDNLTAWLDKRATPDQKAVMLRACRVLLEAGFASTLR